MGYEYGCTINTDISGVVCCQDSVIDASVAGCADGVREGFKNLYDYPNISACSGEVAGYDVDAVPLCADGWHTCMGRDVYQVLGITYDQATTFEGCYAFDSLHDCGMCFFLLSRRGGVDDGKRRGWL